MAVPALRPAGGGCLPAAFTVVVVAPVMVTVIAMSTVAPVAVITVAPVTVVVTRIATGPYGRAAAGAEAGRDDGVTVPAGAAAAYDCRLPRPLVDVDHDAPV